jgi:nicotinamidase-related amidase
MSRAARVQDGFMSSLLRERSRARRRARLHHDSRSGGPMPETTSRPSTALLVMDLQRGIVERLGDAAVLDRAAAAIAAARASDIPVISVRVAFRDGYPEVAADNKRFAALREAGGMAEADAATAIHPAVAPHEGETVVVKRRVSAFAGSDLDVVLRAGGYRHLVLCGISTSGVVLSTLRQASDLDYGLTVLRDACADRDAEVHRVLTEKVFPTQAEVVDVAAWAAPLERAPAGAASASA